MAETEVTEKDPPLGKNEPKNKIWIHNQIANLECEISECEKRNQSQRTE